MPGILTLDSAAELAATLAHTSTLIGDSDGGYRVFQTVTPHLTDAERRRHWETLLDAAARQCAFDDPNAGPRAALDALGTAGATAESSGALCGLDAERYRAVNPADRPDENDYDGYDIVALTLDLATAWDVELVRRARDAVDPQRPASLVTGPQSRAASNRHRVSRARASAVMGSPVSPTG
jgi:hypothetical protein